jgi:hypothetical protein
MHAIASLMQYSREMHTAAMWCLPCTVMLAAPKTQAHAVSLL